MFGVAGIREVRKSIAAYAAGFDAALVTCADAKSIVAEAVAAENMLATIKAMAARRAAECGSWRTEGDRSAAHELARVSGSTVGKAKEALETAERLGGLPAVEAAARSGELSPTKAALVADAASAAPGSETRLLELAKTASVGEVADECARTKAAALPDADARHKAIHASRFLRRRKTADGAGELRYRSTLEEVAAIWSVVQGRAGRIFNAARAEGRREPEEAYLADALLEAVVASQGAAPAGAPASGDGRADQAPGDVVAGCGPFDDEAQPADEGAPASTSTDKREPPGHDVRASAGDEAPSGQGVLAGVSTMPAPATAPAPPPMATKVIVRVDWDALVRGWPIDGETCELSGLGPVPVSVVKAMIDSGNAFLAAVVTKGTGVARVLHQGRQATEHQRTALQWLHPTCAVLGCNATVRLEIDHVVPWASSRVTLLEALAKPCEFHHDMKTNHGWDFVAGVGKRAFVPPDDPRHPKNANAPPAEGEVA